jgi:hypothetical protein
MELATRAHRVKYARTLFGFAHWWWLAYRVKPLLGMKINDKS